MSPTNEYCLLGLMLDVFFAVVSGVAYVMALHARDRLVAGLGAFSFAASCVGAAIFLERLAF